MKIQHFVGSVLMIGAMAIGTSGCFATRVVRDDPGTEYTIVNVREIQALPQAQTVAVAPTVYVAGPPADGTLVVEALVVPPPPATPAMPVRLPAAVAAVGETRMARADVSAPAWDPLPSYVGQFQGNWMSRPLFTSMAQPSGSFRGWSGHGHSSYVGSSSYGSSRSSSSTSVGWYGAPGSAAHFSGGASSSHFAGGGMSSSHFAGQ